MTESSIKGHQRVLHCPREETVFCICENLIPCGKHVTDLVNAYIVFDAYVCAHYVNQEVYILV